MMCLDELRKKIDETDEELLAAFKKRMELSCEIAKYKKEHQKPVYDPARERALLTKVSDAAGADLEEYARTLYLTLMDVSKAYQRKQMDFDSEVEKTFKDALNNQKLLFPKRATVACQGIEGAYSQMAAERLFAAPDILFFQGFEKVFSAIEAGLCRYGILPIENSTAGSVKKVYDLMIDRKFKIVRTVRIKIDHNLLAKKGTKIENIKEIYSHKQALMQCASFLETFGKDVKITEVENTAVAAQMVANSERNDVASLSSVLAGECYGLEVLKESVEDYQNNHTRFICIASQAELYPGADRTSLMMVLPHKPGSLYRVLSKFNALGVNLLKLESRPLPQRDFEFMFYFDVEAPVTSESLPKLLSELEEEADSFAYLGSYSEII